MRKTILLDNDGVICLPNNWGGRNKKIRDFVKSNPDHDGPFPVEVRFDDFDKDAVAILNEIIEATGAEIVVSSDWQNHATLEELGQYYLKQGIIKAPIDVTGYWQNIPREIVNTYAEGSYSYEKDWTRYTETKYYVEKNNLTDYVIIDDLYVHTFEENPRFVHTIWNEGLKQTGLKDKIINILNEKVS